MPTHQSNNWLSCYLYYQSSADKLLSENVRPFVRNLTDKKQIAGFFFIRYADKEGPHIRLRLKPSQDTATRDLKCLCRAAFPDARFIKYIPELRRYGGRAGMEVAEQLFEASSTAVLRHMTEAKSWTYTQAMGSALQLHLGMASGLGMGREELVELFGHIASYYYQNDATKAAYFAENLKPQKARIVPHLMALWNKCEQETEFTEQWFSEWRQEMRIIKNMLCKLQDDKQLRIPEQSAHERNSLWYLYESYIHMTNNRLGISRQDEPFVAYIIEQALKSYA